MLFFLLLVFGANSVSWLRDYCLIEGFIVVYFVDRGFMTTIMASRIAVRNFSRRFSSSGKVLSEEEKAAENVYIKVMFLQLLMCTCVLFVSGCFLSFCCDFSQFHFYMNAVTLMQTKVLTCAILWKFWLCSLIFIPILGPFHHYVFLLSF